MNQANSSMTQQMLQAFQGQHLESAERLAKMILKSRPRDLVALQVHGLCLAMQGRVAESVIPLYKASQQDQKNPELLSNLAKAQFGAELYIDAIHTYKKLDRLVPNNPQILTDMGTAFAKASLREDAAILFNRAIEIHPTYFLAWSNRGNLLSDLGSHTQAIINYQKSLEINPNYPETWTGYGNALYELDDLHGARLAHEKALEIDLNFAEAWSNHGNVLKKLGLGDEAYISYQRALALNPKIPCLLGHCYAYQRNQCDWNNSFEESRLLNAVEGGELASLPFYLLQTSAGSELQKKCAENFISKTIPNAVNKVFKRYQASLNRKIRIAYFSSDFKDHPVGILVENILRHHDRSRFEVCGVFLNRNTGDEVEERVVKLFDEIINIYGLDDLHAETMLVEKAFDIAIDLNGHTSGARTGIFSRRIAPIQVNYLGFAGTSGAVFYDALIADELAIPPEQKLNYSEAIAYLPNSFFPVDTSISHENFGDIPSRASQGLPESGFIFTCFNNSYKITPAIFDVWMNLLKEIPSSVLWLSKPSTKAVENLKIEASSRGVNPARLIFASRTPGRKEHLSRLRLADLFLDTPNYNAHATAGDALWAGVPLLTLIGKTFAGRVAASQLNALGLNDLIVDSDQKYFDKAVELARHPELLGSIRAKLDAHRASSTLFDTKQYVKDLESLYLGLLNKAN